MLPNRINSLEMRQEFVLYCIPEILLEQLNAMRDAVIADSLTSPLEHCPVDVDCIARLLEPSFQWGIVKRAVQKKTRLFSIGLVNTVPKDFWYCTLLAAVFVCTDVFHTSNGASLCLSTMHARLHSAYRW